jgi:hypothetical protein
MNTNKKREKLTTELHGGNTVGRFLRILRELIELPTKIYMSKNPYFYRNLHLDFNNAVTLLFILG